MAKPQIKTSEVQPQAVKDSDLISNLVEQLPQLMEGLKSMGSRVSEEAPTDRALLDTLLFEDKKVISMLHESEDEEISISRDKLLANLHSATEASKPKVRRKVNQFRNSTFGTILEVAAITAGVGAAGVLSFKKGKKTLKKRKEKKATEVETDSVLTEGI